MALMDDYKPQQEQTPTIKGQPDRSRADSAAPMAIEPIGQQQQQQQQKVQPVPKDSRPAQHRPSVVDVRQAAVKRHRSPSNNRKPSQPVRHSDELRRRRDEQRRRHQSALMRKLALQMNEGKELVEVLGNGGRGGAAAAAGGWIKAEEEEEEVGTSAGRRVLVEEMRRRQRRLQQQVTGASQRCEDLRARLMENGVVPDRQALYGEKLDALVAARHHGGAC